jgi:hypothetical protein
MSLVHPSGDLFTLGGELLAVADDSFTVFIQSFAFRAIRSLDCAANPAGIVRSPADLTVEPPP